MAQLRERRRDLSTEVQANQYEILGTIASRETGHVLEALIGKTGKKVAIKILEPTSQDDVREAEKEVRLMRRLAHKNLMSALDVYYCSTKQLCIVMERMLLSLDKLMLHTALAGAPAAAISFEVVSGLAFLHAQGIVHRDLKPSNVLLDITNEHPPQAVVKVTDYRHSLLLEGGPPASREKSLSGTLPFMAPEVFHGEDHTPKVDIWSWGITLVAMANRGQLYSYAEYFKEKYKEHFLSQRGDKNIPTFMSICSELEETSIVYAPSCRRVYSMSGVVQREIAVRVGLSSVPATHEDLHENPAEGQSTEKGSQPSEIQDEAAMVNTPRQGPLSRTFCDSITPLEILPVDAFRDTKRGVPICSERVESKPPRKGRANDDDKSQMELSPADLEQRETLAHKSAPEVEFARKDIPPPLPPLHLIPPPIPPLHFPQPRLVPPPVPPPSFPLPRLAPLPLDSLTLSPSHLLPPTLASQPVPPPRLPQRLPAQPATEETCPTPTPQGDVPEAAETFVVPFPENNSLPLSDALCKPLHTLDEWMVRRCLQLFPEDRPTASDLLGHAFHLTREVTEKLASIIREACAETK